MHDYKEISATAADDRDTGYEWDDGIMSLQILSLIPFSQHQHACNETAATCGDCMKESQHASESCFNQ